MLRGGRQEGRILVLVGDVVDVSSDMFVFFFTWCLVCHDAALRLSMIDCFPLSIVYHFVSFK